MRVGRYWPSLERLKRGGGAFGAVLLGLALFLGGGSSLFPLTRMFVELGAAGVLVGYAMRGWRAPAERWTVAAIILIVLMFALPVIQLIPLPFAVWTALPGRGEAADIIRAEGLAPITMPISLQPDATRLAAAFLLPPVATFIATLHAGAARRVLYGWTIVTMALVGALLGLLQTSAGTALYLYSGDYTAATGFFTNKNHHADLLLLAMPLLAALTVVGRRLGLWFPSKPIAAGAILVLALSVVAANSRMGLLLLPVAIATAGLVLLASKRRRRPRWPLPALAALAAAVLAVLILVAEGSGVAARALDRFGGGPDARLTFWPDVVTAIGRYQPVGSGLGSFVSIFQRDEAMTTLSFTYVNHAHNDVLEIALEAGWAGIALVIAAVVLWLFAAWRALRPAARGTATPLHVACVVGTVILAVHSQIDYPLRTLTLACTLAFLVGCLAPEGEAALAKGPDKP